MEKEGAGESPKDFTSLGKSLPAAAAAERCHSARVSAWWGLPGTGRGSWGLAETPKITCWGHSRHSVGSRGCRPCPGLSCPSSPAQPLLWPHLWQRGDADSPKVTQELMRASDNAQGQLQPHLPAGLSLTSSTQSTPTTLSVPPEGAQGHQNGLLSPTGVCRAWGTLP